MKPKVSIVIPTYNHLEDCLKPCLDSIILSTDLSDKEIIVVANGCNDGTTGYVSRLSLAYPCIKLLSYPDGIGFLKATNIGMQVAKGDYVILLNNDCVILPYQAKEVWIRMLNDPFNDNPKIGITGSLLTSWGFGYRKTFAFYCVMISRKLIETIGYLDETYDPGYFEDAEYCFKAMHNGFELAQAGTFNRFDGKYFVGNFPIWHKCEQTYGKEPEVRKQHIDKNSKIFEERWKHINKEN